MRLLTRFNIYEEDIVRQLGHAQGAPTEPAKAIGSKKEILILIVIIIEQKKGIIIEQKKEWQNGCSRCGPGWC